MSRSILIVDDNTMNRKLMEVLLDTGGYEVRGAPSAEEALVMLAGWRPDLILMDVQLPGMNGLELTRRLKSDPATRSILILAITAAAMKGDEERILAAGCDGYIAKPVDTRTLPGLIAARLSSKVES